MQSRLPSLLYQIILLRRESSGTGRGWRERRQKSCRIQTHFFLRNWHDKKTSHISLFGSGGEREQEILGTVKFGRSYLFMAVFLFKACEDLSYYHWLIPWSARIYSPPSPFSAQFLLRWSPRQPRHPTYDHFPHKISSSRFHIADLSKSISSCLLQAGPMLHRCQIWYLNNEKGNSRLVGLNFFKLLNFCKFLICRFISTLARVMRKCSGCKSINLWLNAQISHRQVPL